MTDVSSQNTYRSEQVVGEDEPEHHPGEGEQQPAVGRPGVSAAK